MPFAVLLLNVIFMLTNSQYQRHNSLLPSTIKFKTESRLSIKICHSKKPFVAVNESITVQSLRKREKFDELGYYSMLNLHFSIFVCYAHCSLSRLIDFFLHSLLSYSSFFYFNNISAPHLNCTE